ncbi:hypothetical protein GCM10009544_43230 [Streptomyces stramineus]|uniref:Uncharacterized protein n=1 Tax=Streptomyces stramineus TaxID=173861 RepID=A0ABN1AHE2_9ACTN
MELTPFLQRVNLICAIALCPKGRGGDAGPSGRLLPFRAARGRSGPFGHKKIALDPAESSAIDD